MTVSIDRGADNGGRDVRAFAVLRTPSRHAACREHHGKGTFDVKLTPGEPELAGAMSRFEFRKDLNG